METGPFLNSLRTSFKVTTRMLYLVFRIPVLENVVFVISLFSTFLLRICENRTKRDQDNNHLLHVHYKKRDDRNRCRKILQKKDKRWSMIIEMSIGFSREFRDIVDITIYSLPMFSCLLGKNTYFCEVSNVIMFFVIFFFI